MRSIKFETSFNGNYSTKIESGKGLLKCMNRDYENAKLFPTQPFRSFDAQNWLT